ncbi:MAG TPA: hypothetical protein PKV96_04160 [Candidatus Saccharimonas sp.]|jgi:hypothetical protein|nr:hypothetical protein [Candidatus Saccharimonas sp.]
MKKKTGEILRSPWVQLGAMTLVPLLKTTILDHRESTHRSLTPGKVVRGTLEVAGAPFTDTSRWAVTHIDHHSGTDANLLPTIEIADLIEWLEQNPDIAKSFPIPDSFMGLDPSVPEMSLEEVLHLGKLSRQLVEGRYVPQANYTNEEIQRILYSQSQRYMYETLWGNTKAVPVLGDEPSLYDIRYKLRDPHAPAIHRMGIIGVGLFNYGLYNDVVTFHNRNPQLVPEHLQRTPRQEFIERNKNKIRLYGLVGGSALLRVLLDQPKSPGDLAKSSLKGAVIAGGATAALFAGSQIVNAFGHAGDLEIPKKRLLRNLLTGKVEVKENGSYASRLPVANIPTLDEVGGQDVHHEYPEKIAYTNQTGWRKVKEAPYGSLLEFLAKHKIGMREGPGYEGRRPDVPSEAVEYLMALRRAEYTRTHTAE